MKGIIRCPHTCKTGFQYIKIRFWKSTQITTTIYLLALIQSLYNIFQIMSQMSSSIFLNYPCCSRKIMPHEMSTQPYMKCFPPFQRFGRRRQTSCNSKIMKQPIRFQRLQPSNIQTFTLFNPRSCQFHLFIGKRVQLSHNQMLSIIQF